MNRSIKLLWVGSGLIVLYLSILHSTASQHEAVHKSIYDSFDIDSQVKVYFIPRGNTLGVTIPDYEQYSRCNDICKALHQENEITGYHAISVINALFGFFAFYIIYNVLNEKEEETYYYE